jgi:hypothetical protein
MMGFALSTAHVYRARHSDWIRSLVEANAAQVDEAVYRRISGSPKPTADGSKPFAP